MNAELVPFAFDGRQVRIVIASNPNPKNREAGSSFDALAGFASQNENLQD